MVSGQQGKVGVPGFRQILSLVVVLALLLVQAVTVETANHDKPKDILGDVLKLENDIIRRGNELLAQIVGKK